MARRFTVPAMTAPEREGWADLAVVMTPAYETANAAATAARVLKPDGAAVSMQNGLGNAEALVQVLGAGRVFMGSTRVSADRVGPGCPRATRIDPSAVGELNAEPLPRTSWFAEMLTAGGLPTEVSDNVVGVLWSKFIHNCGINALSAITGLRMGEVSRVPGLAQLRWQVIDEALALATAKGIRLQYPDPVPELKRHTWRKFTKPSMLQHVEAGRPIEIEVAERLAGARGRDHGPGRARQPRRDGAGARPGAGGDARRAKARRPTTTLSAPRPRPRSRAARRPGTRFRNTEPERRRRHEPESLSTPSPSPGLAEWDTPTICNALEVIDPAARLSGYTIQAFTCLRPEQKPMVGFARTATIRASVRAAVPAEEAQAMRLRYYEYVDRGPKPSVVVIQDLDTHPGTGAFWGEVNTAIHKGLGALGVVTNGSIRDLDASAPGFQALAGQVCPSHAWVHVDGLWRAGAGARHERARRRHRPCRPARRRRHPARGGRQAARGRRTDRPARGGRARGRPGARLRRGEAARGDERRGRHPLKRRPHCKTARHRARCARVHKRASR